VSDYESTQRKRNFAVGVFVLAAVVALVWLIFKFGDLPVVVGEMKSYQVNVQFPTARGVQQNTPVYFCGYQVGRVTAVRPPRVMKEIDGERVYHQTLVILSIDKRYSNIPNNVEVKLMKRGLGSSFIDLTVTEKGPTEPVGPFLTDGSRLQGSTGVTSEFFPEESQEKLDALIKGLNDLIANANTIIGDPNNQGNIRETLANLKDATREATATLARYRELAVSGKATSEALNATLADLRVILEKVESGEGSLGRFVNDGRLYEQVLESSEQLELLIQELQGFIESSKENGLPLKLK
jgi:phospholipid/cholesterol/gamma-HCH transport system substrate-binding protein